MKTLFLGAYGFGNLGDEICLMEAIDSFPSTEVWIRTVSKEFTGKFVNCNGFVGWNPSCPDKDYKIDFDRVVLGGGGILGGRSGVDFMSWIAAAQNSGAETHIHNVGITGSNDPSWISEDLRMAFKKIRGFSVRDKKSIEFLRNWGVNNDISLTYFPEKKIPRDMFLADSISEKNILGISIINTVKFFSSLHIAEGRIKELINQYKGMKILPIVSTVHLFSEEENDIEGFKRFYDMFLKGFEIILPETLDKKWWYNNMTPQKLKGLISKCDVLISSRKHNCLHGISCGVKTIGLYRRGDLGINSVFDSLADVLPKGSAAIELPNLPS